MIENSIQSGLTTRDGSGSSILARIDQYELVRELGGGGFGTVYLAKDTVSGVEYAVKGLPSFVKNNREEMENIRVNFALVSRLSHTNIARAHVLHPAKEVFYSSDDVWRKLRVESGDTLMVMEYAPGVTLSQWRKQFPERKVPIAQALEIAQQIASALDYAHEQKILHRDIKPANVMIETKPDGKLVARVLDFGLAAEIRSSMGRVSQEIHDTSGTRPYMAPEQWMGDRQGPATDQYALAVLFHELVTGYVPFASVFDTGDPVVMMNVIRGEFAKLPSELPSLLRRALGKALAKRSAERFATCGEFIAALEGKVKISRGGAETQRNGAVGRGLAILALLAALGASGYYGWMRYEAMAKERKAEESRIRQKVYELMGEASLVREKSVKEEWHAWPHFKSKAKELDAAYRAGESAFWKNDYPAAHLQFLKVRDVWLWLSSNKAERASSLAAKARAENGWRRADAENARELATDAYAIATNVLSGASRKFDAGMFADASSLYAEALRKFEVSADAARTETARVAEDKRRMESERLARTEAERQAREEAERKAREEAELRRREEADRIAEAQRIEEERKAVEKKANATRNFLSYCRSGKYKEAGNFWESVDTKDSEVLLRMADMLSQGNGVARNKSDARKYYLSAAQMGNAEAQYKLGVVYNSGRLGGYDVAQNNAEAVRWWRKAAEQGFAAAQCELGRSYEMGRGIEENAAESLKWYRLAAENGDVTSQMVLGTKYETGCGVEKDEEMANGWYEIAERSKGAVVYFHLGSLYENGDKEHAKDINKAVKWYRKAASKGCEEAEKALKRLGVATDASAKKWETEHNRQRYDDRLMPISNRTWVPGHYEQRYDQNSGTISNVWIPGHYDP